MKTKNRPKSAIVRDSARKKRGIISLVLFVVFLGVLLGACSEVGWEQSYKAGYEDPNGKYCGGSEVMHIVAH